MTPLLILRRARRDVALLLVWMALLAFAVVLAVGQPRLLQSTVDAGARQAVARAGSNADVLVNTSVSPHDDDLLAALNPAKVDELASLIPSHLPPALRAVYGSKILSVLGPQTRLAAVNGVAPSIAQPIAIQVALMTKQDAAALTTASGALPASGSSKTVDVVLTAASAKASGLSIGSIATVSTIPVASAITGGDHLTLRVVGIVSEKPGTADLWRDVPNFDTPDTPKNIDSPIALTVLTDQDGLQTAAAKYSTAFKATIRVGLDPSKFTAAREASVNAELVALASHSGQLASNTGAQLGVVSEYPLALAAYPSQERAAIAQISIMVAGVLGVAAAVLLLVSRLLVGRRAVDLTLERARGASLASIFVRSFGETVVVGGIGTAVGLLIVQLLDPGPFVQPYLLGVVLAVVALAIPLQTVLLVRDTWTGRRVPANRSDRLDLERWARTRRIAVELTTIALAVAAFVALATRGLLETQTGGVDLLLASAPLLLAASITILVVRIYRFPLRLAVAAGRRSTGALGLLAAARAQRSIAVLPLLALTLAVALAVGGGLLAATVSAGQETGSWQRIGADVRVNTPATPTQVASVAKSAGVTGATAMRTESGLQFRLSSGTNFATVIAVNPGFGNVVSELPTAGASQAGIAALNKLNVPESKSGALPVIVSADWANQLRTSDVGFYLGVKFIQVKVAAITDYAPTGYLGGPFVFVNRAALADRLGHALTANVVLVNGPGAATAVRQLDAPKTAVRSRTQWLADRRALALVQGVSTAINLATLATALLTVIALLITVLSGARERGRSLGLVRTLGLPARLGWWLALAELAPILIASLIGGVIAGVGIVVTLEPAMGLGVLAGGIGNPPPAISLGFIAALVGVALGLLVVAVLVEIAVRRRDRLSEVLRVGETS